MPSVPTTVNDVFQVVISGVLNNQGTLTNLFYAVTNAAGGSVSAYSSSEDLANQIIAAGGVLSKLLAATPTNWQCTSVNAQRVSPKANRSVQYQIPSTATGTAGAAATSNVAQVVLRRTANAGRSQVTSIHLPVGTTSANFTGGVLVPGQLTLLSAFGNSTLLGITGSATGVTWVPVVWHRKSTAAIPYDVLLTTFSQSTVRTMRRRTVGIGI